jgi:repressor LexA
MITSTQRKIYDIIKTYINRTGYAPSLREIAAELGIGAKSISLVSRYLAALEEAGYIRLLPHRQRNIELIDHSATSLPIMGRIAAGKPIEAVQSHEVIDFNELLKDQTLFALEVKGDSMIDEGIFNNDKIICRSQSTANEGDIVVALINQQEATLKRISYKIKEHITLIPANTALSPQIYPASWVEIQGVFVGLWRFHG